MGALRVIARHHRTWGMQPSASDIVRHKAMIHARLRRGPSSADDVVALARMMLKRKRPSLSRALAEMFGVITATAVCATVLAATTATAKAAPPHGLVRSDLFLSWITSSWR